MKLADLEAELVRPTETGLEDATSLADARGVTFLCPGCYAANGGPVGTHHILVWFIGVDPAIQPGPARWQRSGSGLHDLTLQPSIQVRCWHGFVTNGAAA